MQRNRRSVSTNLQLTELFQQISFSGSLLWGYFVSKTEISVFSISQPSLRTPFYSVLVSVSVSMALSTVFHAVNPSDISLLSHSVLQVLSLCLTGPFIFFSLYENLLQS